jgi:hypothetical protein
MQYDAPVTSTELLTSLQANPALSATTIEAISSILGIETGSDTELTVAGFNGTTVTAPFGSTPSVVAGEIAGAVGEDVTVSIPSTLQNADVFVFSSDANLTVNFASTASSETEVSTQAAEVTPQAVDVETAERVLVTGNGDDTITINDGVSTYVASGDGADTITLGAGNDIVDGGVGADVIDTGAGNDTIVAGLGDTVDGGTGFDVVTVEDISDYRVFIEAVQDGSTGSDYHRAVVLQSQDGTSDIDLTNVQLIEGDDGNNIAIAATDDEGTVLRLYNTLLDRSADASGAQYWTNEVTNTGTSLSSIAQGFINSEEFQSNGELTNQQFVETLYQNALGREADEGGLAFWTAQLDAGQAQGDVALGIVGSYEAEGNDPSVLIIHGQV